LKQETARETQTDGPDVKVSRLAFGDIPGQSRLFVEYQEDPASLREFYPNAVKDADEVVAAVPDVLANYSTDRERLCDALFAINTSIGASAATFANIERLRSSETVAVVTGQQAGLFSGPLYTIYKALSAIRMAEELERREVSAVPVFWAATEDHDLAEVSEAFFRDAASEPFRVGYEHDDPTSGVAVGSVYLNGSIDRLITSVFERLKVTQFTDEVRAMISDAWKPDIGFGEAFGRTLAGLLGKFGIVYIDPLDPEIKKLAAPIYSAAIERSDEIVARLTKRSETLLDRGFHAQVLIEPDYFPLFWHDDEGVRRAIRKRPDGSFQAKDAPVRFERDELLQIAAQTPERFSPGVMLRAAVQDFLLPTACYFGGGAEVAYFAQNSVVYETLGRPVTPILHRQSFTVVEARQGRAIEKFGVDLLSLFDGEEKLRLRLAETSEAGRAATVFTEAEEIVGMQLSRIDELVAEIDPTLTRNAAKRTQKVAYHLAALRKKALLAEIRRNEVVDRQVHELFSSLMPNGHLQERVLNIFDLVVRYGTGVIDQIYDQIDVDERGHRVIYL